MMAWLVQYFMFTLWSVSYATFIVTLVVNCAPYASGSGTHNTLSNGKTTFNEKCFIGISEIKTILSGFLMYGYLGKWTLLIKSLGMIFATSSGLIIGKEGSFVHISCCCANLFCSKKQTLLFFLLSIRSFVVIVVVVVVGKFRILSQIRK